MNKLSQSIKHSISLKYVNFCRNISSPWGVYCTIIRHCYVNSLTLCGDEGIKEYNKEIIDGLQANVALQSLLLVASTSNESNFKGVISDIKGLQSSFCIDRILYFSTVDNDNKKAASSSNSRAVKIKIMFDGMYCRSPEIIKLSNRNITDDSACLISFGLYNNATVKEFDLSCNYISVIGMSWLSQCLKCNTSLQYVNLSGNKSSPWGVYCAVIRHCCVSSLTLCGDEGINEYFKEIKDSLQTNVALQSLILCHSTETSCIDEDLISKTNWSQTSLGIEGILYFTTLSNDDRKETFSSYERTVNVKVMCGDNDPENVYLSNWMITNDAICLLAFGLYNNTTAKKLDLSCRNISVIEMNKLSGCLKYARSLQYVDLSGNKSSPWGVYCTVIGYCCVNSLTLCGDEGIEKYVKEVIKNLKRNATLQSLTLYEIGSIGVQSINHILYSNTTLKELNMSWKCKSAMIYNTQSIHSKFNSTKSYSNSHEEVLDINIMYDHYRECSSEVVAMYEGWIGDDAVYLIAFGLYHNTTVKKLDLSYNFITDYGTMAISECLKINNTIQELNLSRNCITSKGARQLAKVICINKTLRKLDLLHNSICSDGMMYISDSLKHNTTLLELNYLS